MLTNCIFIFNFSVYIVMIYMPSDHCSTVLSVSTYLQVSVQLTVMLPFRVSHLVFLLPVIIFSANSSHSDPKIVFPLEML
jgi:hypothetical protein